MEKHLLLTVSDGPSASYTLRFVRSMLSDFCNIRLTLLYVAPRAPQWNLDNPEMQPSSSVVAEIESIKKSKGSQTLEAAREWLEGVAGCRSGKVDTKVLHSGKGAVREIIDEAHDGLYDAAVLGSRAYTWFETMFEDSVAHGILWRNVDFPIWICRRPSAIPRRNVLLCTDGSAPCLRMADHVGYMLKDQPDHKVTLFHAAEKSLVGDESTHAMFQETQQAMLETGFPEERIEYKVVHSANIAKAILEENRQAHYAAIALGKRGTRPAKLEAFFPSSLSIKLLRQCDDAALWISK